MAKKISAAPPGKFPMGITSTASTVTDETQVARAIEDYRRGQLEEAAGHLDSFLAKQSLGDGPSDLVEIALAAKGEIERRLGEGASAIASFTRAIDIAESMDRTTGCAYAISLFGVSRTAEATTLLEACVAADPDPEALLHLAEIRLSDGQANDAVTFAEAALQAMPDDLLSHEVYAEALLAAGRRDDAWSYFDTAADLALDRERWEYAADLLRRSTETGVDSLKQTVVRAWEFVQQGQITQAESVVDAVLAKAPNSPFALGAKGQLMIFHDDFSAAERYYRRALELAPEYVEARWGLGEAIRLQERPEEAMPLYQQVIDEYPDWEVPYLSMAAGEIELGNLDEAQVRLDQAFELDPDNAWGAAFSGMIAERLGESDAAIESYRRAIDLDPTVLWVYDPLSRLYQESGLLREAVKVVDDFLHLEPGNAAALTRRGELHLEMGNSEEAIISIEAAWEIDPGLAGEALATAYDANNQDEEIEKVVMTTLAREPETPWALEWQGRLARGSEDQSESVERLWKSVRSNPDRKSSYQPLVNGLYDVGDPDGAKEVLNEYVRRFGDDVWALEKLGTHLLDEAQTRSDYRQAQHYFERASEAGSVDPATLSNWGEALRMQGDYSEARRRLEESLSDDPYDVRTLRRLGYAQLELGEAEEAMVAFQRAVELAPEDPDVLRDLVVGYSEISDYEAAFRSAQRLVSAHPEFAKGLAILGNVLVEIGQFDDAIETLNRAVALDADLPYGWGELGFAAELTGDNDRAAWGYKRAVEVNHHDWMSRIGHAEMTRIRNEDEGKAAYREIIEELTELGGEGDGRALMGWCHYRLGEFREAIELYNDVLEADPSNTFCYFDRGLARLSIRDSAALDDYERGVSVSYGSQSIRQNGLLAVALADLMLAIDEQETLGAYPNAAAAVELLEDVLATGPTSMMS